jgi:RND family efflux transporter MFP subunit
MWKLNINHERGLAGYMASAVMLLVALSSLVVCGCQHEQHAAQTLPVVKTVRIAMDNSAGQHTYTAVVVARHEIQESFRVGGRMEKRLVDVGDHVREGQILATLDEKDLRYELESAQAELRAAHSNREQTVTDERRYLKLLSEHVVSQSEYDLKHLSADEARGRLERADRAVKLAVSKLDYAKLASSADGVVTKVSAEAGQVVAEGQSVVTLARNGALEALVDIPERRIQAIKEANAEVSLWSSQDVRYQAKLREISPAADPATRTYAVRYSLRNADASVRLGMSATLHLMDSATTPTARIPACALFNQGQGPGVWRVNPQNGQLTLTPVEVDHYTEHDAYVRGQLTDGDIIVASGAQKLDGETTVRIAEASGENDR